MPFFSPQNSFHWSFLPAPCSPRRLISVLGCLGLATVLALGLTVQLTHSQGWVPALPGRPHVLVGPVPGLCFHREGAPQPHAQHLGVLPTPQAWVCLSGFLQP